MPARSHHTVSQLSTGPILIVGGFLANRPTSSVMLFDPASNTSREVAPLGVARARHAAVVLPDGRVLVLGGYNGRHLASVELYDPSRDRWIAVAPLSAPRADGSAVFTPHGIWLSGGTDAYRPVTDGFYPLASLQSTP
ncbi:MAG TPA: kelch repeat-containing protein [Fimbriimonas sp.]